jgi:tRNA G18 (ribose-2'-O)-methylase SpoU
MPTPVVITDPQDPRVADFRDLKAGDRPEGTPRWSGPVIVEGVPAVERLLASTYRVRAVLGVPGRVAALDLPDDVAAYEADKWLLSEVIGFRLTRGVIASADRRPPADLDALLAGPDPAAPRRLAVLEGLNDPENLGAVARSARALSIDGLVLDPSCIDPYTRRTVRVSMGEILFLRWCRVAAVDWPAATLTALGAAGFETWAMTPAAGSDDIWTLDPPERLAIALGAEGAGLSQGVLSAATRRVRLPINPDVDSLNVAAAAAAAFTVVARP